MSSLNAPKKSKTTVTVTTVSQKKPSNSKQNGSAGCNSNECNTAGKGQRKSHLANEMGTQVAATSPKSTTSSSQSATTAKKLSANQTKVIVNCDCGFSNKLYIRGEGIKGLNWEKGTLMTCNKADEWVWQTDASFNNAQIKVLLNDQDYEIGENHNVQCGKTLTITPQFTNT